MLLIDPTKLCQIELAVSDIDAAINFYQKVFGWNASKAKIHNYIVMDVPETCPYGISLVPMPTTSENALSHKVTLYFKTEHLGEISKSALKYGGTATLEKIIPGYGDITIIQDLDGHRFGLLNQ